MVVNPLLAARARVVHDLASYGLASAEVVSLVEDVIADRRWWVEEWPQGADYVAGQIAQDVQDRLLETARRWPYCPNDSDGPAHELHIEPELGPDPHWVCEVDGSVIGPLGGL